MKKYHTLVRDVSITVVLLAAFFGLCLLLQRFIDIHPLLPMIFTLAVFLVSRFTEGYFQGILASLISVLAVNYAFTFPHFRFNFTIPEDLISAIIMLIVTIMTSTMTTQIKMHEQKKRDIETERIRSNLLRAISHDIRTPLTAIYGSSATLLECYEVLGDEKKRQLLAGIREDSEWLIAMVENLLSVTRIDGGRLNLQVTDTSVEELIDVVLDKFYRRYPKQEVRLTMPEEFVSIPMDPFLIEQVLMNILENAMQHAKGMTILSIEVQKGEAEVSFAISDDGCGIPKTLLSKLFRESVRQKSVTQHLQRDDRGSGTPIDGKRQGMGIGMQVCASIIAAHGGVLSVENLDPRGCCFRFSLPMEVTGDGE